MPMLLLALSTIGASPQSGFSITTPLPSFAVTPEHLGDGPASRFTPAPLPNRDAARPSPEKASKDASLVPGLFTRKEQYHGEGLSSSTSVQSEQERRAKPGAGFNLRMPLQ